MGKIIMNEFNLISKKYTILVVDDHELIIDSTVNSLRKRFISAEILTAMNMNVACDYLQNSKIDLIVLDLGIPKSQSDRHKAKPEVGLELLSQILDADNPINIVVLSSDPEALVRLKSKIEDYQIGGFTIASKTSINDLLEKVSWSLAGIIHTKNVPELRTGELRSEWFKVLELAFKESLEDKKIAETMNVSLRTARNYWEKIYDVLEVYPEKGINRRIATEKRARELGFID